MLYTSGFGKRQDVLRLSEFMGEVGEVNDEVEEECGATPEGLFKGREIIPGTEGEGYT